MNLPTMFPDPTTMTDEAIYEASCRLAALAQRVAGTPGEPVTAERRDELEPAERYIFNLLHVGFLGLANENRKRCDEEAATGLAELEAFLREVEP